MRSTPGYLALLALSLISFAGQCQPADQKIQLFDGKSFRGWGGDTAKTWRIQDGAIVGGSIEETVPHNEFLVTNRTFENFRLRLQCKLLGTSGFINGGVQFHSKRMTDPAFEMTGYQADLGPKYWASLYDESRRNKTLSMPDSVSVLKWLKPNDWNDYEIRSENGRIQLFLNGHQTVDYHEPDKSIPQSGFIGLQVHGNGKTLVAYRNIVLEELR